MARNRKKFQKNNDQDNAMVREFDKGKRAGRNGKFQRYEGSGRAQSSKGVAAIETGGKDNDPVWYIPNGQLAKDVASIPFIMRSGYPLSDTNVSVNVPSSPTYVGEGVKYIPGVLTHYLIPTFGQDTDGIEAINIAATGFFNSLRQATSGTSVYDKNDAMLYLLSIGQLYSLYSYMCRIYGVINNYAVENAYTPRPLVNAMGCNFENFQSNLAEFRTWLNQFAYQLQAIPMPNVLTYVTRQIFIYESIYADSTNGKSQYMMYAPHGFYQYSEGLGESKAAGQLTYMPMPYITFNQSLDFMTLDQLKLYANNLLSPILGSQDLMQFIGADVIKAYGASALYHVAPISETFTIKPVYNKEVLEQMENAYIYDIADINAELKQSTTINQSSLKLTMNLAIMDPRAGTDGAGPNILQAMNDTAPQNYVYLNSHEETVTPERVLTMTRLSGAIPKVVKLTSNWTGMVNSGTPKSYDYTIKLQTCGTEIVAFSQIRYYRFAEDLSTGITRVANITSNQFIETSVSGINDVQMQTYLTSAGMLSSFDWNPQVRPVLARRLSSGPEYSIDYIGQSIWDIDNYTRINIAELYELNHVAVFGEFASRMPSFSGMRQ